MSVWLWDACTFCTRACYPLSIPVCAKEWILGGVSCGDRCALVNSQQTSFAPPEMKNVKGKKARLLVNIFKSKHQGWVHGGRSPALPRECTVRSLFRWKHELLCVECSLKHTSCGHPLPAPRPPGRPTWRIPWVGSLTNWAGCILWLAW